MAPRAFVIMPFSQAFQVIFEHIIVPALEGYEVARADSRLDERGILEKIITGIDEADLVIADITTTNANVMYELGVAHALGKPTVMIAQSLADLPFDIRSYPVHEYSSGPLRESAAAIHLQALAAGHRNGLVAFANPVTDFLPRLLSRQRSPSAPASMQEAHIAAAINERASEIEWASDAIGTFFEQFHALNAEYIENLGAATARVGSGPSGALSPNNDPGIRAAAFHTRHFADELSALSERFRLIWERAGMAMLWLVAPDQRPYIGNDRAKRFADTTRTWEKDLDDLIAELAELRRVNGSFPDWSGNLTQALGAAAEAITSLLNEVMTAKSYSLRIIRAASESA